MIAFWNYTAAHARFSYLLILSFSVWHLINNSRCSSKFSSVRLVKRLTNRCFVQLICSCNEKSFLIGNIQLLVDCFPLALVSLCILSIELCFSWSFIDDREGNAVCVIKKIFFAFILLWSVLKCPRWRGQRYREQEELKMDITLCSFTDEFFHGFKVIEVANHKSNS